MTDRPRIEDIEVPASASDDDVPTVASGVLVYAPPAGGSGYTDEQVRDVIGAALVAGTGMTVTVNDGADTITLDSTGGYSDENARDAIAAMIAAGSHTGISFSYNDGADSLSATVSGGGGGGVTASVRRATGSGMSVASTTWTALDTSLDLTLAATTGDWVTVSPMGAWAATGATFGAMDVVTVVSGSAVNSLASGAAPNNATYGTYAWGGITSTFSPFGGSLRYQLQSGDISGGNVTVRIVVRTDAAITKSVHCSSLEPFNFSAQIN